MTQSGTEFAQSPPTMACHIEKEKESSQQIKCSAMAMPARAQHSDILLGNFQIKKKRYRVLLNYDHIVWEQLDAKRNSEATAKVEANSKKDPEFEAEQLSQRATYGRDSHVLHVNELIRVSKGNSKSEALQLVPPQPVHATPYGAPPTVEQAITSPPTAQYLALSYAERIVHSSTDCNRWRVRKLVLYNTDAYVVRQWHTVLNKMLNSAAPQRLRVRRLLVFINPYGGRKQGLQIYERHCKPLFQLAGIDASCIISQRSNQIRDILYSHDLTPFDAVCCVGGDGTVAEVINGLLFRAIRDAQLDARQPAYVPKPSLPIAIIPAGSTDTVAYSLHGTADVRTAAIHLILGQRRGMDICSIRNSDGIVRFCASVLSYGYLGDVAAKSEKYRWMGTKRYEFAGVKAFLLNNGYEAEIRLQQSTDNLAETASSSSSSYYSSTDTAFDAEKICCANCARCNAAGVANAELATKSALNGKTETDATNDNISDFSKDNLPILTKYNAVVNKATSATRDNNVKQKLSSTMPDFDSINDITTMDCDSNSKAVMATAKQTDTHDMHSNDSNVIATAAATSTSDAQGTTNSNMNSNSNNYSASAEGVSASDWKTINGKFFMISGTNITCACSRSPNGISRYAHLGDGCVDLVLVRKTSLLNNVRLLFNTMGRNGDIRNLPFVEVHRTRKFCFRTPYVYADEEYASTRGSCHAITDDVDNDKVSRWNCDGEVITDLELIMSSHCQLIDAFMRGPYIYSKPTKSEKSSIFCCCNCCKTNN